MTASQGRDIITVAASASGLEPLRTILAALSADFPASVLVVLHIAATGGRTLPRILDRAGALPAAAGADGELLRPGRVYVAPRTCTSWSPTAGCGPREALGRTASGRRRTRSSAVPRSTAARGRSRWC